MSLLKYLSICIGLFILVSCGGNSSSTDQGENKFNEENIIISDKCNVLLDIVSPKKVTDNLFNEDSISIRFNESVIVDNIEVFGPQGLISSQPFLDGDSKEVLLSFTPLLEEGDYNFFISVRPKECQAELAPVEFFISGSVKTPKDEAQDRVEIDRNLTFPKEGQIVSDRNVIDLIFTGSVEIGVRALSLIQEVDGQLQSINLDNPRISGDNTRFIFEIPNLSLSTLGEGFVTLKYEPRDDDNETYITSRNATGSMILDSFDLPFILNNPSALSAVIGDQDVNFEFSNDNSPNAFITVRPGNTIGLQFDSGLNEQLSETNIETCQNIIQDNTELVFKVDNQVDDIRDFTIVGEDCQNFILIPNTPLELGDNLILTVDLVDPNEIESLSCGSNENDNQVKGLVDNFCEPVAVLISHDNDIVTSQVSEITIDISVPELDENFDGLTDVRLLTGDQEDRIASEISLITNDGDNTDSDNITNSGNEVDDDNPTVEEADVKTIGRVFREFDQIQLLFDEVIQFEVVDNQSMAFIVLNDSIKNIEIPLGISENDPSIAIATFVDSEGLPNPNLKTAPGSDVPSYKILDIRGILDQSGNPYIFNSSDRFSSSINRSADNPLNQVQFEERFIGLTYSVVDEVGKNKSITFTQSERSKQDDGSSLVEVSQDDTISMKLDNYKLTNSSLSDEAVCSENTIKLFEVKNEGEKEVSLDSIDFTVPQRTDNTLTCELSINMKTEDGSNSDSIYIVEIDAANRIVSDDNIMLRVDGSGKSFFIGRFKMIEDTEPGNNQEEMDNGNIFF